MIAIVLYPESSPLGGARDYETERRLDAEWDCEEWHRHTSHDVYSGALAALAADDDAEADDAGTGPGRAAYLRRRAAALRAAGGPQ